MKWADTIQDGIFIQIDMKICIMEMLCNKYLQGLDAVFHYAV